MLEFLRIFFSRRTATTISKISKRDFIATRSSEEISSFNAVVKVLRGNVIVSYNDILKETQLLVLSGQAVFQSRKDPNDRIVLKKGLWGGIGGRFRDIIGETVVLSSSVQKQFIDRKL